MKVRIQPLAWAGFLLFAGVFLLLKNLGVFDPWGEAIWGGLFVAAGLGFLIWFLFGVGQWWRAVPGFTLLSVGALVLLGWRGLDLGDWRAALPLLGMALGFWTALLTHADHWWAVIPAGALTLFAALTGLQARLGEAFWLAILFLGLGLIFLLVYLPRRHTARWASIPAATLSLLGVVTLVDALQPAAVIAQWWPTVLLFAAVGMLVIALTGRQPAEPVTPLPIPEPEPRAAGASVIEALPPAPPLPPVSAPPAPGTSASPAETRDAEAEVDIYELLKQQPKA